MVEECDRELVHKLVVLFGGNGLSTSRQAELAFHLVAEFRQDAIRNDRLAEFNPTESA